VELLLGLGSLPSVHGLAVLVRACADKGRDLRLGAVLARVTHAEAEMAGVKHQSPDLVTAVNSA